MHPYPHQYIVSASAATEGTVAVRSERLPQIATAPPPQFDGPEGHWSPETLLTAAVADCFILTFRAVARASKFPWSQLDCSVEAVLDRAEGVAQFTAFRTTAVLTVPAGTDVEKAQKLLEKAEHGCLIANSLRGTRALSAEVRTGAGPS